MNMAYLISSPPCRWTCPVFHHYEDWGNDHTRFQGTHAVILQAYSQIWTWQATGDEHFPFQILPHVPYSGCGNSLPSFLQQHGECHSPSHTLKSKQHLTPDRREITSHCCAQLHFLSTHMCLLAIQAASSVNCLFTSSVHFPFFTGSFSSSWVCRSSLHILDGNCLYELCKYLLLNCHLSFNICLWFFLLHDIFCSM